MGRLHLEVGGRVQGVGFRWFVREMARGGDLAGWVRNRPDGRVEIAASGDDHQLASLTHAVHAGPPGARVEEVQELSTEGLGDLPYPFTVLR